MVDPESPKEKNAIKKYVSQGTLPSSQPEKQLTVPLSALLPKEELFKYLVRNSETVRNAHGVAMEKGKLIVKDKARLDNIEPWQKEILREFWFERNQ